MQQVQSIYMLSSCFNIFNFKCIPESSCRRKRVKLDIWVRFSGLSWSICAVFEFWTVTSSINTLLCTCSNFFFFLVNLNPFSNKDARHVSTVPHPWNVWKLKKNSTLFTSRITCTVLPQNLTPSPPLPAGPPPGCPHAQAPARVCRAQRWKMCSAWSSSMCRAPVLKLQCKCCGARARPSRWTKLLALSLTRLLFTHLSTQLLVADLVKELLLVLVEDLRGLHSAWLHLEKCKG